MIFGVALLSLILVTLWYNTGILFFIASLFALLSVFFPLRIYNDLFSPLTLLGAPWFGALAVYELHLLDPSLQPRLTPITYIVIYGSALAFFFGWVLASSITGLIKYRSPIRIPWQEGKNVNIKIPWQERKAIRIIVVYLIIGSIVFFYMFQEVGGLKLLISDPNKYRHNLFVPVLYNFFLYPVTAAGIVSFIMFLYKGRTIYLLLTIFSFVLLSLRLARMTPIMFLLILLTIYSQIKIINLRQISVFSGLFIVLFLILGVFRNAFGIGQRLQNSSLINVPFDSPVIATLYVYIAPGFRNIQIAINDITTHTYGVQSLYGIYTFFPPIKDLLSNIYIESSFSSIGVFETYIIDYYIDFGLIGTLIVPCIIGFFGTYTYHVMRKNGNVSILIIYSLVAMALVLSFVDNRFSHPSFWRIGGMVLITHYILLPDSLKSIDHLNNIPTEAEQGK